MKVRLSPLVLVFLGALLAVPGPANAASGAPPAEVVRAAQHGLASFVRPRGDRLGRLGISNQAEADAAVLGDGIEVFTIPSQGLLDETTSVDLTQLATPVNQWQFVVEVHGAPKALLTVALVEGTWTAVAIGGAKRAREVSAVAAAWPRAEEYHRRLVRIPQVHAEFVHVSRPGRSLGVVPLGSLHRAVGGPSRNGFDPRDQRDPSQVLSSLRPIVRRSLEAHP